MTLPQSLTGALRFLVPLAVLTLVWLVPHFAASRMVPPGAEDQM